MDVHRYRYNIEVERDEIKLICTLDVSMEPAVGFCEYSSEQITRAHRSVY